MVPNPPPVDVRLTVVGPELRSMVGPEMTVIVAVSVSVSAPPLPVLPPSFVVIVSVTLPGDTDANRGAEVARKLLIALTEPVNVMEPVPLPETVTPPAATAVSVPLDTESVVDTTALPASASAIARPVRASDEVVLDV